MTDDSTAGAGTTPYPGDVAAPGTLTEAQHQEIPHRAEAPPIVAPPVAEARPAEPTSGAAADTPADAGPSAEVAPAAEVAGPVDYGPEPQSFAEMGLEEDV